MSRLPLCLVFVACVGFLPSCKPKEMTAPEPTTEEQVAPAPQPATAKAAAAGAHECPHAKAEGGGECGCKHGEGAEAGECPHAKAEGGGECGCKHGEGAEAGECPHAAAASAPAQ